MLICLILGGKNACQDGLGHFFLEIDLTTLQNCRIGPEKVPQSARLSARGEEGSNCYICNVQMKEETKIMGLPLS